MNRVNTHVTVRYINRLGTNAAQYSTGGLRKCLADSGPFCHPLPAPGPSDYYDYGR